MRRDIGDLQRNLWIANQAVRLARLGAPSPGVRMGEDADAMPKPSALFYAKAAFVVQFANDLADFNVADACCLGQWADSEYRRFFSIKPSMT